jgi:hypothetical protein
VAKPIAIKTLTAHDGQGLRASQTISGATTRLAWNLIEGLPLILSDGTNSYIYGPDGLPVEQVSSGGTVTYLLHHDQQGSTRLLTGSTGTVTGKCTYGAYGAPTCEGATTTTLGYDGQYTSSDTGLIYMRARVYDPATSSRLIRCWASQARHTTMRTTTPEPRGRFGAQQLEPVQRKLLDGRQRHIRKPAQPDSLL